MKNPIFFLIAGVLMLSQNMTHAETFDEVPQRYQDHPELGLTLDEKPSTKALYELVHLRTENSRTILNADTTRTTIHSSLPLHYKDRNGHWLSLRHELTARDGLLVFPSHNPEFVIDTENGSINLFARDQKTITQTGASRLVLMDDETEISRSIGMEGREARIVNSNIVKQDGVIDGFSVERRFFGGAFMNKYVLHESDAFDPSFQHLIFEESLELPEGFSLKHELDGDDPTNRILILNDEEHVEFVIQQPIVSDHADVKPKLRQLHQPHQAKLTFEQTGTSSYVVRFGLSADWINDEHRVYPILARSLITVESDEQVDSCMNPQFQQSTITVDVPDGETVLWSDFEYDFVAVGEAWISDQRSFVSGPSGSTSVFAAPHNTSGTHTYTVELSEVGNGLSTGEVEYIFHSARIWGGDGCNASFNFINRRVVSVTYGTFVFGDGPVTINEYSASNRSFQDGFNRTEDWIELHNTDPDHYFDLEGYYLSNDINDPTQWRIANGIIPPGGHILVFASRRDISSGMVQHANFNLTQLRPDSIVLADPDGHVLEAHSMHVTQLNHSYGRVNDGDEEWGVFTSPTPGGSNSNPFTNYASTPIFDMEAGSYTGSVTLTMESTGSNEQIRYTTDGTTPTSTSTPYTAPLVVDETTVVRARAFSSDANVLPSFIETRTYLVNEDITLPVFSFSGDQDLLTLFGGNASLRPLGHFEYFESDGQFIDGNFGDFNKHGNDSWNYDQRGVDFISRDDYGYKRRLEHKFFETSDRTRFRRLMVKAAANDNYPFEPGGAHIRDSYIQHLSQVAGLDLDERSSTNVLVFVNGQYWGVYDLRERVDDNNFTDHYYGQDYTYRESDIHVQFLKTWAGTSAHFGNQSAINDWTSLRQYVQQNDMGNPEHFEYVSSQLNIESLIDYFVINSYVVSRDWLNYNTGWWRGLDPAGSARDWRYILWDMEAAFGHFTNYTNLPDPTHTAPPCQAEALTVGDGHTDIIRKLIQQNPAVRTQYVTRYVDLLNTHFSDVEAIALLDHMIGVIAPEMPRHISRWGGNLTTWEHNVEDIRTFITDRYNYLMDSGLASCYGLTGPYATDFNVIPEEGGDIRMNSEWLPSYPFNARVFGNIQTTLNARGNQGFSFSHWEIDGADLPSDVTESTIELMLTQATSVTAVFDPPATDGDLVYYWHFNDLETPEDVVSIEPDHVLIEDAAPLMTYTGSGPRDIDANNTGSDLNLHLGEPSGRSARVRNPSEGRSLVFDLPTAGYEQINFTYAVERTNNGMLQNEVSYSIDGVNFIQDDLPAVEFNLKDPEIYYFVNLDFSEVDGVSDNPDFKIRIDFSGNTTGGSGNNRFDNITLKGTEILGGSPDQVAFSSINNDEPVYADEPFLIAVQVQDGEGLPAVVDEDKNVTLSLVSGSGSLSGTLAGTILAGNHSTTIDGVIYSQPEAGVSLEAAVDQFQPAISLPFEVLQRSYTLALSKNVEGAGTVSGGGVFHQGESVVITAIVDEGFAFDGWIDQSGQLFSDQPEVTFSMPASDESYTANFGLPNNGTLMHYWHFNDLDSGTLELVDSDFSIVGAGMISYPGIEPETPAGVMDRRSYGNSNPVSNFNLRLDQMPDSGNVLRVRNPSNENMLRIEAPSDGYMDIVVSFAATRTNNGAQHQEFFFSSDSGVNWTSVGEPYEIAGIDEEGYVAKTFNLSEYQDVNNNPYLVFKILFLGEEAGNDSGNNRFDNFSVEGVSIADNVDLIFSDRFQ